MNRRSVLLGGAAVLAGVGGWFYLGSGGAVSAGEIFTGKTPGVAINGYDVVAYHTQNAPVKGDQSFTHKWSGVDWHFSSAENRDAFSKDPKKFAPQYNGFCAYAVAHNTTAKTEPEAFTVVDNKLYLNYDKNIQSRWEGDKANFITKADEYWPGLVKTN